MNKSDDISIMSFMFCDGEMDSVLDYAILAKRVQISVVVLHFLSD